MDTMNDDLVKAFCQLIKIDSPAGEEEFAHSVRERIKISEMKKLVKVILALGSV